jgi:predicted RND superfamily exporter protein
MIIYIVLGIAADDIFVFFDAWKQSEHVDPEILDTKEKRLAYSWRRAVKAMAVTSSTTAVAFFANAFSPLLNIAAFGIFAGIIVPINYFLVVMIFPPAVIIYETHILEKKRCICWANCCASRKERGDSLGRTEKIFDTKINDCTKSMIGKIGIIAVSLIWFAIACFMTSKLEPLSEMEEWIDPDHEIMKVFTKIGSEFPRPAA